MRRLSNPLVLALVAASLVVAAGRAAAQTYFIEVQSGGTGTVTPSGLVEVPAGGSQTFTFTPSGCQVVNDVLVDDVAVGFGLTEYTFTNVQSDHVLYVSFGPQITTTAFDVRPVTGQCAVPETLTATVSNSDGGQVQFFNGATLLNTRTLASGVATYIVASGLFTGSYSFSASYLGTNCSYPSSSPAVPYDVSDTGPIPWTLTLSLSPRTLSIQHAVVATTKLRIGGAVASTQSGQVTYYDGATVLSTVALVFGGSSGSFRMDTPGVHVLTAVAQPTQCVDAVTSEPETLLVIDDRTPTSMTLTISPPGIDVDGSVLLTAIVNRPNATGLIHFLDVTNGVEVGAVFTVNSRATFTYGPLLGSSRTMQAQYDGDSGYQGCTSNQTYLEISSPLPPPPPPPSGALFSAPFLSVDTGNEPHSVVISDLNADGRADLAVACAGSNAVSVLLGKGDATFGLSTDFGTGLRPNSVAIADLNSDGRADLVTANADSNTNTVSVLLGNGDGTFGLKTDFGTGRRPSSVAIADLNADGRPDLVTANADSNANTVSVLLGNGDGTFGPKTDFTAGVISMSVAIGDFDANGHSDLAVANAGSNTVSVLPGNGVGTFGARTDFTVANRPVSIATADLNTDGRSDLVVANSGSNSVSVLLGNGLGGFDRFDFATGINPLSVAIGDLNADGRLDLAVADQDPNSVSALLGNGDGTFEPRTKSHTGNNPYSVAIGELNADGQPDLAVATAGSSSVSILLGSGNGTFGSNLEFATGSSPVSVATSDLNADGRLDLAVANSVSATVSVRLGNGNGTFRPRTDYSTRTNLGSSANSVGIADFNGDGRLDLVVADWDMSTNKVLVLLGNGDGTFGPKTGFATGTNPVSVATADLNADGRPDLVTADSYPNLVSVLLGNGNGTFQPRSDFGTGSEPHSVAISDLNADGRPDVVTANDGPGANSVSVLLGNGNGTFGLATNFGTGSRPFSVAIADLNADGRPDLVTANSGFSAGNTVSVLLGNGDGTFGAKTDFGTGSWPVAVAIGDLDADGRPDLAVANHSPNTVSVLLGNGDGTFGAKTDFGTGSIPYALAIGDFNTDGLPDLAVANAGSNTVTVLLHTPDHAVATLLAQFDATSGPDGIELRWSFGDASRVSSATVERAPDAVGPWAPITPELRHDGDVTAALDRTTDPGRTYFYRLTVRLVGGSSVTFGPISSTVSASIGETAVNLLAPNPAREGSQIQYTVARPGHVRLEVADVGGRVVTTLFDGVQPAGRFQLAWDGTNRGERLPAGLYFVRLTTLDRTVAKKFTRLP